MKNNIIVFCIFQTCVVQGATNLGPAADMTGVPQPVQAYAESLYPNKTEGTVLRSIVEVTSELTRTFFPTKRFFAIHAVNRELQALISQGDYRSIASLENDKVAPAGAVVLLKGIPVADRQTATRVVQLYSHLYAASLVTPDIIEFAKLDLDPKDIVKIEQVEQDFKVTAHFGSRVAVTRAVFLMSKDGVSIDESKEVFRSVYYR